MKPNPKHSLKTRKFSQYSISKKGYFATQVQTVTSNFIFFEKDRSSKKVAS